MVEFSKNKKQKSIINKTNNIPNISAILEISTRTPEII